MFKKSLVSLLLVLMVLLMALPITAFASENQDPAILSDEATEPHKHELKLSGTYNANAVFAYCTTCTYAQTSYATEKDGAAYTAIVVDSVIPILDDSGAVVGYEYTDAGLTIQTHKGTATQIDNLTTANSGTTHKSISVKLGNSITIKSETSFNLLAFQIQSKITSHTALLGKEAEFGVKSIALLDSATPTTGRSLLVMELHETVNEFTFTPTKAMSLRNGFIGTSTDKGVKHPHTYTASGEIVPPTCVSNGYTITESCVCGLIKTTDVTPHLGGHKWIEVEGHGEIICQTCGESKGHNHEWIDNVTSKNGASQYCASCASYSLGSISLLPRTASINEIYNEFGTLERLHFETSSKALNIDVYPYTGSYNPATNNNSVRVRNGNVVVISVSDGTFSELTMFFPGNSSTTNSGGTSAKMAFDEATDGTFINRIVGIDHADISVLSHTTTGVTVKIVLDAPVSELRLKSSTDHFYLGTVAILSRTVEVDGEHTHDHQPVNTPHCTDTVASNFICADCGYGYAGELAPVGHTPGAVADCENDQTCTVCGDVLAGKLGHSYNEGVETKAPTCTDAGEKTFTCANCGDSYTEAINAHGHSYDDGVETKAPTCTDAGEKTFTCANCGDSYTEAIKAHGHTPGEAADCENDQTCTVCGDVLAGKLGHSYDEGVETKAPTCTEDGVKTFTCANCGDSYTEAIKAHGHTPGAAADCENDQTCTVCGEVLVGKLGHSYGTDGYCTVCGEADPDAAFVAAVNGKMYLDFDAAYAAANAGDTITLLADISASEIIVINKAITLDGNGKTLTSTAARAINIETDGNVTIKNLTINAGERAINVINKPAKVTVENISATAKNNAIMLATSAAGAQLTVNGSNLTGLAVINIASAGSAVEINDTVITNVDATDAENYGAITVWTSAEGASVVVNGGSINVADGSKAAYVFPADATIALNGVADAEIGYIVAIVGDAGFETLAEALEDAKAGQTVKLVRDVSLTKTVNVAKNVTLDLNGNTISGDFTDYYGIIYVKRGATLTIEGEGAIIAKACDAIGNYGTVIVNGGNITTEADPYYGAIYNFYYTADFYGTTVINGGKVDTILNSGNLTVNGGEIAYIDNSGKLAVAGGEIGEIIAKDGTDAEGVVGAGTVEIADTAIITVPDGYDLVEIEAGVYQVLAHDYKAVVTNPDCVNGGYTTHTCVNCGDSYTDNETEALGHSYDCEETKAPTCTEDGENTFTCSKCGDSYTEAIKAHGHRYSSVKVTSATCTEDGYITLGCGNCGIEWDSRYDDEAKQYLIDNPYFNLSAKGHKHEASVTAPTCTEDGFTTYTCACGDSYTEAGEPAKGHRYNKTQVFTFCEEEGYILIDCANCGKQFDSRYDDEAKQYLIDLPFFNLAPKGHKYENGVCTNEGCNATIGRIDEAKVNLGADLGVKWYVVLPEGADVADYVFTVEFLGESFVLEATEADGRYMYFFANIAPQNMGDNMKATLTKGDASISVDAYSVKQNLLNIAENNAELKTLVADLLNYGAASQVYMGYNVDNLVNADVTFAGSDDEIVNPGYTLEGNAKENSAYFKSANVLFASTNRVVVKIVVNTNATLVVGEKTYNLTAGEYEIYSRDIAAYKLFDNVTFTLTGEDGNVTTLNYSVAAYAATKAGNETAMGNLATALYYYAKSVKDIVG